ncbi:PIG-L family deacetylase [Streptomyces sp. NPDC059918]|uniref:PIG-L family deacetylase n=1 Tax=unclassified Streptomyces TaxID=2593676 RepID=UPI0036519952
MASDAGKALEIVAHPDDDLFFINPDLQQSISSGHPVTTVYLTSGEGDGVDLDQHRIQALRSAGLPLPVNKPLYSEARQNGIRAAYALMATGTRTSPWRRTVIATAGGGQAELDILKAKPSVQLVWLEMKEAESISGYSPVSLHGLWDGNTSRVPSMLTTGTPVRKSFSYNKDQVIATLAGILEHYRPTLVRTQDPTPGQGRDLDHQDHIYGARFTQAALSRYAAVLPFPRRPHFTVQNYLGYQTSGFGDVLNAPAVQNKLQPLKAYAWADERNDCKSSAGCGDLHVAASGPGQFHWADDIRYARGNSTTWMARGAGGRAEAFAVLDGQLALWREDSSGTRWSGPQLLPGTGLDPGVHSVTLADGRTAVFATQTTIGSTSSEYRRAVVYAVERAPGSGTFTPWRSLGAPAADTQDGTVAFSAPAVLTQPNGHMSVYVRDGNNTLRARYQTPAGSWTPWQHLGGTALHGDPVAAVAANGIGYVFAATPSTVTAWTLTQAGKITERAIATGVPTTTLALAAAPADRGVGLWFRQAGTGEIHTMTASTEADKLRVSPTAAVPNISGYGPAASCQGAVAGRTTTGDLTTTDGSGHSRQSALRFSGAASSLCRPHGPQFGIIGWDAQLHLLA